MGRALGRALSEAGERVNLWSRREAGGAVAEAVTGAATVILAVPDDAIAEVAATLAGAGAVATDQVVLHVSGVLDARALAPLHSSGAALGSLHPLRSVSDPEMPPDQWRGAYATVEGDDRATREAERLARLLGLVPVQVSGKSKATYHAGAVFAANYVVVLAAVAARLARQAGIPDTLSDRIYLPLLRSAVDNLMEQAPAAALTGPVRRGDLATIRAHLEALGPEERALYRLLGLEALGLARTAGLEPGKAEAVERLLRDY
jgi:predicted short-subunit dehydrogenase-like oxidoreductase (DUF2520 family)